MPTFREHRVIEPPKISEIDEQNIKENSLNINNGLGAILEAPEESINLDVDMLSQEDENDLDLDLGSRNSLLNKHNSEIDSDEDIGGSRNSLSGLKRWTTEENLCSEKGSRTEAVELVLHLPATATILTGVGGTGSLTFRLNAWGPVCG